MSDDGLGRLWAGWRTAYVTGAADAPVEAGDAIEVGPGQDPTCVLCRVSAGGDGSVVWRGALCAAILNAYPYTSGHLMVMPLRHVGDLEEMTEGERAEMWDGVRQAIAALKAAYRPGGLNVGMNLGRAAGAGVPGHLHVHVLPRWDGDTNFMTAAAGVRVMPESLPDTRVKVVAAWGRLDPPG